MLAGNHWSISVAPVTAGLIEQRRGAPEAAAMGRAGPQPPQGIAVGSGAVALVPAQLVAGEPLVQTDHQGIPQHLGHDRGGRDAVIPAVAAHPALGAGQAGGGGVAVDADRQGGHPGRQGRHRPLHGPKGGLQDIEAVHFVGSGPAHGEGGTGRLQLTQQALAAPGRELLGVGDAGDGVVRIPGRTTAAIVRKTRMMIATRSAGRLRSPDGRISRHRVSSAICVGSGLKDINGVLENWSVIQ